MAVVPSICRSICCSSSSATMLQRLPPLLLLSSYLGMSGMAYIRQQQQL